jgi:hypothetical protein
VKEIQDLNRKGIKPEKLIASGDPAETAPVSQDLLRNNSLTRFDKEEGKHQTHKHFHKRRNKKQNDKKPS